MIWVHDAEHDWRLSSFFSLAMMVVAFESVEMRRYVASTHTLSELTCRCRDSKVGPFAPYNNNGAWFDRQRKAG